jgi:hypothetical protein
VLATDRPRSSRRYVLAAFRYGTSVSSRAATSESLERLLDLLKKALSKSKGRDKVA